MKQHVQEMTKQPIYDAILSTRTSRRFCSGNNNQTCQFREQKVEEIEQRQIFTASPLFDKTNILNHEPPVIIDDGVALLSVLFTS